MAPFTHTDIFDCVKRSAEAVEACRKYEEYQSSLELDNLRDIEEILVRF